MKDEPPELNKEAIWNIIELNFDKQHLKQLVKHQLESYNYFVDTQKRLLQRFTS